MRAKQQKRAGQNPRTNNLFSPYQELRRAAKEHQIRSPVPHATIRKCFWLLRGALTFAASNAVLARISARPAFAIRMAASSASSRWPQNNGCCIR